MQRHAEKGAVSGNTFSPYGEMDPSPVFPRDQTMTASARPVRDKHPTMYLEMNPVWLSYSEVEARKEQLSKLEVELHCQRCPAVVEPDVTASAKVDQFRMCRDLEIKLKDFLRRLQPSSIRWIHRDLASTSRS